MHRYLKYTQHVDIWYIWSAATGAPEPRASERAAFHISRPQWAAQLMGRPFIYLADTHYGGLFATPLHLIFSLNHIRVDPRQPFTNKLISRNLFLVALYFTINVFLVLRFMRLRGGTGRQI